MGGAADICSINGQIMDSTGQVFSHGTWQLLFKPNPNYAGPSTVIDAASTGTVITPFKSGTMDASGNMAAGGNARNDFIAPAGTKYTLIVQPQAVAQAWGIDVVLNASSVNVGALINPTIGAISASPMQTPFTYKDSEITTPTQPGAIYYDTLNNVLKIWNPTTSVWDAIPVASSSLLTTGTGLFVLNNTPTIERPVPGGTAYSLSDISNSNVNAAVFLSSGWGSSAPGGGSSINGTDEALDFNIVASGTGIGLNPNIHITFKDGTWTRTPVAVVVRSDLNAPVSQPSWTISPTGLIITFAGTPGAGAGYHFNVMVK